MVSYYGFKAMGPGVLVEHPGSVYLSRTKQSKRSYKKIKQGDGDAHPTMGNKFGLGG